jgi:hypothetical protein
VTRINEPKLDRPALELAPWVRRLVYQRPKLVLVPPVLVMMGLVPFVLVQLSAWALERRVGPELARDALSQLGRASAIALIAPMVLCGIARATAFHPAANKRYREWLALSPWTPKLPLPLGPIMLAWQDLLLVGVTCALTWWKAPVPPATPAIVFFAAYLLAEVWLLSVTKQGAAAIVLAFGLAAMLHLLGSPNVMLAAVVVLYACVAHPALRMSLHTLPWTTWPPQPPSRREALGWPLKQLGPELEPATESTDPDAGANERLQKLTPVSFGAALVTAALVGWIIFSVVRAAERNGWRDRPSEVVDLIVLAVAGMAAFIRFGIYCGGYRPPISTWGRLWTGRWIIPRYDVVYVGPLMTLIVCIASIVLMRETGTPASVRLATEVGAVLLTALTLGPTLRTWRLTGAHQMARTGPEVEQKKR